MLVTKMFPYWLFFLVIPVFWVLDRDLKTLKGRRLWVGLMVSTVLFIGLRYRVGCDWQDYADLFNAIRLQRDFGVDSLRAVLNWGPTYLALNWVAAKIGGGVYLVNLVCAALAISGLAIFCRALPSPWVGWAIAFPYFTTVVCMGYTRQSVAIGLFFGGLELLKRNKVMAYAALIILAGTFHITALALLPLLIFPLIAQRKWNIVAIIFIFSIILAVITLPDIVNQLHGYTAAGQTSKGAIIRGLMTAFPALLLLIFPRLWDSQSLTLWRPLAVVALLVLVLVLFASTAVDRIGLYLLPLQVFVWGRLPSLPLLKPYRQHLTLLLFSYSGLVLWVWLTFGLNARCWIPYRTALIYS